MSFADDTLDELLAQLEAPAPSPCGGAAAAITAAMACSLTAMVARGNPSWEEGAAVAARAVELRAQLVDLAWRDTQAVTDLVRLKRLPEPQRSEALALAIRVPAEIREAAQEAVALAEFAEANGKRGMQADATAARLVGAAAARVAERIASANRSG